MRRTAPADSARCDRAALRAQIRDAAIEQIGAHGFRTPLQVIADAAEVSREVLLDVFGSKRALIRSCDDYIAESVRESKSAALQSMSPQAWFEQMAAIDSYAPMMAYLVQSLRIGGELGKGMVHKMTVNVQSYLADGERAGTVQPSRDPEARAKFLAINNGGGFLLYLQTHPTPKDIAAVLRDYAAEMVLPALEVYTHGLLTDSAMEDAFVSRYGPGDPASRV